MKANWCKRHNRPTEPTTPTWCSSCNIAATYFPFDPDYKDHPRVIQLKEAISKQLKDLKKSPIPTPIPPKRRYSNKPS